MHDHNLSAADEIYEYLTYPSALFTMSCLSLFICLLLFIPSRHVILIANIALSGWWNQNVCFFFQSALKCDCLCVLSSYLYLNSMCREQEIYGTVAFFPPEYLTFSTANDFTPVFVVLHL